jgi:ABC-type hemin transport system ATPase subunit
MSVFSLSGYSVSIGGRRLVGPVDLDIAAGQCAALVGESG